MTTLRKALEKKFTEIEQEPGDTDEEKRFFKKVELEAAIDEITGQWRAIKPHDFDQWYADQSNEEELIELAGGRPPSANTNGRKSRRPRGYISREDLRRGPRADAVTDDLLDRLAQHEREGTLPRGPRGLFYDLRPLGIPGNPRGVIYTKHPQNTGKGSWETTPQYVTDHLAMMRRVWTPGEGFLVDEDWISDGRMPDPETPNQRRDARAAADTVLRWLRDIKLIRQAGQDVFLEVRCEAADLMPRLSRIALPYGVPVYSGSGFDGLKPKKEAAERAAGRSVPTIIAHFSDLDSSGGHISNAFTEDAIAINEWCRRHVGYGRGELTVERLALTEEQAEEHDLLDDDGTAEVEGLPVPVMDALLRDWIESKLDAEIQRRVVLKEAAMRRKASKLVAAGQHEILSSKPDTSDDWAWAREDED
jgi:hypothetical protein